MFAVIRSGPLGVLAVLSARQLEVAELVATGRSSREIAHRLSVSPRTVEAHIAAIFEKLGIRTRSQLVALVVKDVHGRTSVGNVPASMPELVGRENDLAALTGLTEKHRLVTILGTGGVGKTQTALRVAAECSAAFPDGIWFVDLLSLSTGEFIASEIARLFAIPLAHTGDVLADLISRLKTTCALLIFDNCEHLGDAAGRTIAAILRGCSRMSILTTSRERVGVSGETTYRLQPLDIEHASTLFIARAQAVDHRFTIDDRAVVAIDELCRKLDCIPLAIELASARCNVFSPHQLLERLEQRFTLLDGGLRDVSPRHQSLRAVIDWSYDQLDERERDLFRRLSLFTGRFSLPFAQAISGFSQDAEPAFLDTLSSLIDKSLVVAEPENDELSYRLLESTRLYAGHKLEECAQTRRVALAHARYLKDSLNAMIARAKRWSSPDTIAFFRRHLGDIRAALEWAIRSREILEGAELLAATNFLWSINSIPEGIAWTDSYLALLGTEHAIVRANLLSRVSELHWRAGDEDRSIASADRAVAAARESGDEVTLGEALVALAVHTIMRDTELSRERLRETEALANISDLTRDECLHLRARLTYISDDYESAIPMFHELNEAAKRANDISGQAECMMVLAIIEHRAGRYERAVEIARAGIAVQRDGGEAWALALSTSTLAAFLIRTGDLGEAKRVALESLSLYAQIDPESPRVGTVLEIIGYVLAVERDLPRAAQLQGLANAISSKPGTLQSKLASDMSERFERIVRSSLADEEIAAFRASGAKLNLEDAIALAASSGPTTRR